MVAGPCSVESPEQVTKVVAALAATGKVNLIRGGIWKPRTRPNAFEGIGEKGIAWLVDAARSKGLPVAVEVANASHVEAALKFNVEVMWVGARTTVNPFSVQEIADVLQGTEVQVMVKNPVNPDLQLWIGAVERIQRAGISHVAAIHRGFTAYAKSIYRNDPRWEIPIGFMRQMPHIPIICDPSHIAGNRTLLVDVAQKAMDLNMHGLMLEVHPDPDNAMSDKDQQVTPEVFIALMDALVIRSEEAGNVQFRNRLQELRSKVDELDDELVNLLARRMELSDEIGAYKKANDVTILQLERYNEILTRVGKLAEELGFDKTAIHEIMARIHQECIQRQTTIFNDQSLDDSSLPTRNNV